MERSWRDMNINSYPKLEKLMKVDTTNLVDIEIKVIGNKLRYQVLNQNLNQNENAIFLYSYYLNRVDIHIIDCPDIEYCESEDSISVYLRGSDSTKDKNI